MVTQSGNGEVSLAGTLFDDFAGSALNSATWLSGNWSGGSWTPTFTSGAVQVAGTNGAWVRSQSRFTRRSVEGVIEFGAATYQHFGFASENFDGNRYAIFSTAGTTNRLYARSNNNASELQTDLGTLPAGLHRYRIEWTAVDANHDNVNYYLDGTLVATHYVPINLYPFSALYVYLSHNGASSAPLRADQVAVAPDYVSSGSYTSAVVDAGQSVAWSGVSWQATLPSGTSLNVEARTSTNGTTWGNWTTVATSGANPGLAAGRYIQYRLTLATSNAAVSPTVTWLALSYGGDTPTPPVTTLATTQALGRRYTTIVIPNATAQPR